MTPAQALAACGLPREDALPLLAHASGRSRGWLLAHHTDPLPDEVAHAFAALAGRRRRGEPVAYLVGRRAFRNIEVEVTPAVLIPRPETELLVDLALAAMPPDARVLDVGTGSGAVALAIAAERADARVIGSDSSDHALAVAAGNRARLGLRNVALVRARWLEPFADDSLDVVVGNPPYVAAADSHLTAGDLRFEPRGALAAGADGLDALRAVIAQAPRCLRPGGRLLVEHGFDQAERVRRLFADAAFEGIGTTRDGAGHERVTSGTLRFR